LTIDHLSNGRLIVGFGLGDAETGDKSFSAFHEESDLKRRAAMLDEGLAIIDGLWRGEPFSFRGAHFTVEEMTLLPRPLQQPRIPIWIGGAYPLRGPVERALRWDGACLYRHDSHFMMPDDIADLRARVVAARGGNDGYEISVGGSPRREDWNEEREYIRGLRDAGATWWIEYAPPDGVDVMRTAIARGPLRLD
jgi:alkanesulfonate monooxygenase SsuD/methylene tetrahydromethanopterin reductase-like flavin-dependent oxidoreductase (luciferase family)